VLSLSETDDEGGDLSEKRLKKILVIHIGRYHASRQPMILQTVLGSCVACCLFDPIRRIGGMNHILLPGQADLRVFNEPARWGIHAMELLINRIMQIGGSRQCLQAKIFGGANLMPAIKPENGMGRKNIAFTRAFLENENIPILNQDVGGTDTRRIYFHTDTNDVYLKRIPSSHYQRIYQETKALTRIEKRIHTPARVTLFNDK